MSDREDILQALFEALRTNVTDAEVVRNDTIPRKIPEGGMMILRDGDPGEPEVTMSPLRYHYEHQADLEVLVQQKEINDALFDQLTGKVGKIIEDDRTLGGLCDWVEGMAPAAAELNWENAPRAKAAVVPIILHYATEHPL